MKEKRILMNETFKTENLWLNSVFPFFVEEII